MPRIRAKTLVALVGIVGLILALGVAATRFTTTVVPDVGGTYIEGVIGFPSHINPILCYDNEVDQDLVALVFNGLTTTNAQGVIIPDLAERWEISEDGLRYTFFLRKDVRWHDGAPFTSNDVRFTIQAMQDPSYKGPADQGSLWRSITLETPDEHTAVFTLTEPFGPFLEYTTQRLLPSHILSTVSPSNLPSSEFNAKPVGTGPYKVVETVVETDAAHVTLEANRNYYGPLPRLARLQFRCYPGQSELFVAYRRGEVAGISQVRPEDLQQIKLDLRLNLYSAPYASYSMIFLNLDRPVFKDLVVRRALWQAIDRQGLIGRHLNGQGIVMHGPILPNSWAYDPQLPRVTYDPGAAAAALEAAGWKDTDNSGVRSKDGVRLEFTLLTNNEDLVRGNMIGEIAQSWAAIGVRATTSTLSTAELVGEHLCKRDYDAILYGWGLSAADPDPYPLWHSSQIGWEGQNYVGYRDSESDKVLEEARRTYDRNRRKALYSDFQRRFVDQVPALLLYQPIYNYAVDVQVKGVQISPLINTGDRFRSISDWYITTRRVFILQPTTAQTEPIPEPTVAQFETIPEPTAVQFESISGPTTAPPEITPSPTGG